jgi:hypothetical protein
LSELEKLNEKQNNHPELYTGSNFGRNKSLLDALYEEGIIPTYSFPKNVVSVYINDENGNSKYQPERGLDLAISEYAPGKRLVVDKHLYQMGGLYLGKSERYDNYGQPAKKFLDDKNYVKTIYTCNSCNWFGSEDDINNGKCPLCEENINMTADNRRELVRPWGFGVTNGKSVTKAKFEEKFTFPNEAEYSGLVVSDDLQKIKGFTNAKISVRTNQNIITRNTGIMGNGFDICTHCGASMPKPISDKVAPFNSSGETIGRPYTTKFSCAHTKHYDNFDLGFEFKTDMFVMEIELDTEKLNIFSSYDTGNHLSPWIEKSARSFSEALHIQACSLLDIEFTEIYSGYRLRQNKNNSSVFLDVYLYDSLSSGAGYSTAILTQINKLMNKLEEFLSKCDCDNSCQKCLKHYRNQQYHSMLDRFSALDLFKWIKNRHLHEDFCIEKQWELLSPLQNVLYKTHKISKTGNKIVLNFSELDSDYTKQLSLTPEFQKEIVVFPYMKKLSENADVIYISDFEAKYAKAFATQKLQKSCV